jgi:hypothetical protein
VQPRSAKDVSRAVSTLVDTDAGACKFAVRSGGHTTWAGANDISDGVTIDLSMKYSLQQAGWNCFYPTWSSVAVCIQDTRTI